MPNPIVRTITVEGTTYDLQDNISGYTTNTGTITGVTAGTGLSGGGSSGSVTLNHSNSVTAKSTQGIYPITFDAQGHITGSSAAPTTISGYGITDAYTKSEVDDKVSAVLRYKGVKATIADLPSSGNTTGDVWHVTATSGEYAWNGSEWEELGTAISIPSATGNSTTGISIADHSTGSITGVQSTTTTASKVTFGTAGSVTGVSGSTAVRGVKTGTNSTTTASKASGANGTAPTLGTTISVRGVKTGTNSTTTASKVTVGSHSTDYGVTAAGSGSFTQGTFSGGSLTMTINGSDSEQLDIVFTAATHGSDSHTHTPPTLGSKIPTVSASDVTVPIRDDSDKSIPNVTSVGSASTWSFTDVTVPIRADSDTTVPIAGSATSIPNISATDVTVPIKDTGSTTVVTGKTHTVTDNGHTHSI